MKAGYSINQRGIGVFSTIWVFNFSGLVDMVQWDDTPHVVDNPYLVAVFKIKLKEMKAVINEKVTQKQKCKYPYLGTSTNDEGKSNVVLFIAHNEGTVVQSDCNNTWPLGEYDTRWAEDNVFTPFTGSITLSND